MARLGGAPDHGETEATATLLTLYAEADLGRVSPSALFAAPGKIAPTDADVDVLRWTSRRTPRTRRCAARAARTCLHACWTPH